LGMVFLATSFPSSSVTTARASAFSGAAPLVLTEKTTSSSTSKRLFGLWRWISIPAESAAARGFERERARKRAIEQGVRRRRERRGAGVMDKGVGGDGNASSGIPLPASGQY